MPTGSINNGVSAHLPASTSNYVSPFLVTFSCSSFFVIAVLLYVRPYLEAAVTPYRPLKDPYRNAYWLCYSFLSNCGPHSSY